MLSRLIAGFFLLLTTKLAWGAVLPEAQIFEDSKRSHSIKSIKLSEKRLDWKAFDTRTPLGYSHSRFWIRFQVPSHLHRSQEPLLLEIPFTYLERASLYALENGKVSRQRSQGMGVPDYQKILTSGVLHFPLLSNPRAEYFLSVEGNFPLAAPLLIKSESEFLKGQLSRQLFLGAFFGLLLMALVYNSFLTAFLKSRLYLFYSLFVASAIFLYLGHERLTIQLFWPRSPAWAMIEMHIYGAFHILFYSVFVRSFLETKLKTPWFDKLLLVLVTISMARTVWLIFQHNLIVGIVGDSAIVLINFLILVMTAARPFRGERSACYFVVSSLVYNVGTVLFILHVANVFRLGDWVLYAPHIGISAEVILLSLALGQRIRKTNNELASVILKLKLERTQRIHAEEALKQRQLEIVQAEKMGALGQMAAGIAHEVNNPLAIIYANANLIEALCRRSLVPVDKLIQASGNIEKTVFRISQIIKSMRNLARDTSQDPLTESQLSEIFQDVSALCVERFRLNQVQLEIQPIDSPVYLLCRSPEISQVLINLLNNAFDAVQGLKEKKIHLGWRIEGSEIIVSVTDNGPGVSEELVNKIYEPFFTTKQVGKGTGLGLSISRSIIESHNGRLWIEQGPTGTRFAFALPGLVYDINMHEQVLHLCQPL